MSAKFMRIFLPLAVLLAVALTTATAFAGNAIYTTDKTGTIVNQNIYTFSTDVYLSGGPQNTNASGLPDGTYYFQVTDPSGKTLLSTDNAVCRELLVSGGVVVGSTGPCPHATGTFNPANGATPVELAPFSVTSNAGGEYKAWLIPVADATIGSDLMTLIFSNSNSKTDNFKVQQAGPPPPPPGSCLGSSSLSALVQGTNVTSYVPKGAWNSGATGVSVVNIEGTAITPTLIPTAGVVNSCASNPITGQTVCSANDTDVYLLSGTTLNNTLTSSGTGLIGFSGGVCTNCGVMMDAVHNKAALSLAFSNGVGGFQFLDLATSTFEPAFATEAPATRISENPLLDPINNVLLSASEVNNYEVINVATTTSPAFFENPITNPAGEADSSSEDCSTRIALAPYEFTSPSQVYLADLTQATFTPGSPGTWTTPATGQQIQTLSESFLAAGASGSSVAQGTHTGVISGEFGGNTLTAVALPTTSGSGTPAFTDWVSCAISGWTNGDDPHTVTAYQTPNGGDAIALLANFNASQVARVDLTMMLNPTIVPRTVSGHGCASGTLPSTVVTITAVP